ncbi:MAG: RNA polymerase sigma factor [Anaerovoracaceae bacterium]
MFAIEDEGDKSKYCIIYELHAHRMLHTAYEIIKDTGLAEDIVHQCFLELFENEYFIKKFDNPYSPATGSYLKLMARSRALNLYNKNKRQGQFVIQEEALLGMVEDEGASIDRILSNAELVEEAKEYISWLSPEEAAMILLKYYDGFKNVEIAEILNITSNLVGVRLDRIRKKLAKRIRKNQQRKEGAGRG